VLAEYEKAKSVTRDRLHLETMEKILPDSDKVILDGGIGQRLLPLMPLGTSPLLPATLRPAAEPVKGK
jgi:membrane protease subunit HflK